MKLVARLLEKPWGKLCVPHANKAIDDRRIGEVRFDAPTSVPLAVTVKYLYTSERLSVQVHPNDEQARARGHDCGKDEMWIVLSAEPGATIGLGLKREASDTELRTAIADGTVEEMIDWRSVKQGDVIYNSAGTIHAAGAGLVLLEIQQSADLTYRLYDYGRERALHLDEGLSVARRGPHRGERDCTLPIRGSRILIDGPHFGTAWCDGEIADGIPSRRGHYQVAVISGEAIVGTAVIREGECGLASSLGAVSLGEGCKAVICWPETTAQASLARAA